MIVPRTAAPRHPIRAGVTIWPQVGSWQQIREAAIAADRAGLDAVWTWDHLYPIVGDPHGSIFEGWSTLGSWAEITEHVSLGLMVGANTFRNPGVVAKAAVTIDHASHGRAWLGLGGAWFEPEHQAFGIDFGSGPGERLNRLEASVGAIRRMLGGEAVTMPDGGPYRLDQAVVRPLPYRGAGRLPIMIGGSGEQKTLRTVARHADGWNANGAVDVLRRKAGILAEHCAEVGRDIADIEFTFTRQCVIRDDVQEAARVLKAVQAANGRAYEPSADVDFIGPPALIAERWRSYLALGFTHLVIELPAPYDRETIERLAEVRDLVARG